MVRGIIIACVLVVAGATSDNDGMSLMQTRAHQVESHGSTPECAAFDAQYPDLVKVDFALAENTNSNLGGLGPQSGNEELYYRNVAVANAAGDAYDLRITVIGDAYTPNNVKLNGENGHYGQINVACGSSVSLKFQFLDQTSGDPASLQRFMISWFDMDQGRFGGGEENIILWPGYASTFLSTVSEVLTADVSCPAGANGKFCTKFSSSTGGVGADNPKDPLVLTEQQAARTFAVYYEGVSEFSVTLTAGDGKGGRNFLFTGMSEVAYADVEECCPDHICGCKAECADIQQEDKCSLGRCAMCDECQTTTTTTTKGPASKEETCADAQTFEISSDSLAENGLGDEGGQLLFKNVATHNGASLDLSVTDVSGDSEYAGQKLKTYTSDHREYTGEFRSAVRIAVDDPGHYMFRFKFLNQQGALVKLPLFPITFYDIDGKGEIIKACNVQGAITVDDTLLTETYSEPCYAHAASKREVHLPQDFDLLNANQKKQTVTYVYRDTAEWDIGLTLRKKEENRYIIFKSSKVLACDYEDYNKDKEWKGDKDKEKNADQ